jgi:hypothetical protein
MFSIKPKEVMIINIKGEILWTGLFRLKDIRRCTGE